MTRATTQATPLSLHEPRSHEPRADEPRAYVLTCALAAAYAALRPWRLTQFDLGRDELFSLETARLGWRALLAAVAADAVHPPLFYLLLKLWLLAGGETLSWLKLFPALTACAALAPLLLLGRELRLRPAETNVALALAAANAYLVAYAHELRMYSLLLLTSLCALWLFARWWNRRTPSRLDLLLLALAHLLLVYTQYYGWLVVGVELLFVALWRRARLRQFAALVALVALGFAPWFFVVLGALGTRAVGLGAQLGWHYCPDAAGLAAYYALLDGPFAFPRSTTLGLFLYGLAILRALWDVYRNPATTRGARLGFGFLLALSVLPVACAFVVSRALPQSVWHTRYLIVSAVPYLLLVACALARVRPPLLRLALTLAVCAWAGASAYQELRRTDTRIAWDVLARGLSAAETSRDGRVRVYALDDFPRYPMNYYLRAAGDERFEFVRTDAADLPALGDEHFWLVYDEGAWPAAAPAPPQLLTARGYRVGASLASGPRGHRYLLFPAWRE
jgi:hypothetical protein